MPIGFGVGLEVDGTVVDPTEMPAPGGGVELKYCQPDMAIATVRHYIESESGYAYGPGEAPGAGRRLIARATRAGRTGFTASVLRIEDENGCLCVALARRACRCEAIRSEAVLASDK